MFNILVSTFLWQFISQVSTIQMYIFYVISTLISVNVKNIFDDKICQVQGWFSDIQLYNLKQVLITILYTVWRKCSSWKFRRTLLFQYMQKRIISWVTFWLNCRLGTQILVARQVLPKFVWNKNYNTVLACCHSSFD